MGDTVVSDTAHIVVKSQNITARANRYHRGAAILVFGLRGTNVFDARPTMAEGVTLPDGTTAAIASGLGAFVYDAENGAFTSRMFALQAASETATADAKATSGVIRCNVCMQVYDPAKGDPTQKVKPGTLPEDLPDGWKCPGCGCARSKFMPK
jgi:rubredoxin